MANITQIPAPRVPLLNDVTGAVSVEWFRWFNNVYTITGSGLGITPVINGGTGLGTIPTNGQLLIGNGTGYTLNTLTAGTAITVTNGLGTITVTNNLPDLTVVLTGAGTTVVTGTYPSFTITSNDAFVGTVTSVSWTGGIVSVATPTTTPAFTIAGTSGGIPYFSSGTAWASSGVLTASRIVLGGGAGAAPTVLGSLGTTTTVLHGNAAGAPTFGAVSLTADVSGTLPIANGGTGTTSTTFVNLTANVSGILPIANGGTGTSTAGVSATIVTAKLTALGADGSMTFTNGLLTAQTPAT
tara:strand:- start:306 stop:1199 length:894 start_codon:yes stop_codon:yes gene_type:complete